MAPRFGTSGLRGLVAELTPPLVADHIRAFLAVCDVGRGIHLGRDLRESSPAIARAVADAARGEGIAVTDCGALPTPALALAAMAAGQGAVMVTGSHIPADRNGLKFYTRHGEISKADEGAILSALGRAPGGGKAGGLRADDSVARAYVARHVAAFGPLALAGLRLGVWQHSSVARDLLAEMLARLGAEVVPLGREETFTAVDTEAVDAATRVRLAGWVAECRLDALLSTDGDGDRPLLVDAGGRLVPGDTLGHLTAAALGAGTVVTPITSNSGIERDGRFRVIRTRIGSPFVIEGMKAGGRIVGYEANGGFLLGFAARGPEGGLAPLLTRDAFLPMVAVLAAARAEGAGVAGLVARLPARFTASDRLTGIDSDRARALLAALEMPEGALAAAGLSVPATLDRTDGLRFTDGGGAIVHFRPSGNAPEFRVHAEAETRERAEAILAGALDWLRAAGR